MWTWLDADRRSVFRALDGGSGLVCETRTNSTGDPDRSLQLEDSVEVVPSGHFWADRILLKDENILLRKLFSVIFASF